MPHETLKALLRASFPQAEIDITDMYGDGQHLKIRVASNLFKGKTLLIQHRMVYDALEGIVGDKIHAVSLHTQEAI